ncbi:hypothetical protein, partial [Cloacibacillus porcorum]|uniref:hypothetical protein n=1 Tax=Cloacibacillus porcorum TaxID=1197717 RepID=UPI002582EFF6
GKSKAKPLLTFDKGNDKSLFPLSKINRYLSFTTSGINRRLDVSMTTRNKAGKPQAHFGASIARQCPRHVAGTLSNYPYCRGMRVRLPQDFPALLS